MLSKEKGGIVVKILIVLVLLMVIAGAGAFLWYKSNIQPAQTNSEKVVLEIEYGTGINKIAGLLEENGVIKSANAFKIYCKINKRTLIKAGKYEFDKNMTIDQILSMVEEEKILDETVTITFPEGRNMKEIASIIAKNTNNSEEDVYNLLKDEEYLDKLIEKYWFITDSVKDSKLYYSLEGYLYPDTYIFSGEDVSVEAIFEKMLDKMDAVITPYKEKIEDNKYSIHELLSLASMVELEAKNKEDRYGVASVFYNRLEKGMALQSDVTTYYGLQIAMDERDLTMKELDENNGYNTRSSAMAGKIPLGPICMVSDSAIKAVLNPDKTSNIYFVADKNGKVYFSETNEQHEKIQKQLKDEGLWFTYDN